VDETANGRNGDGAIGSMGVTECRGIGASEYEGLVVHTSPSICSWLRRMNLRLMILLLSLRS
jgi:hypothetical protein